MMLKLKYVLLLFVIFFPDISISAKYHSNGEIFSFMQNFSWRTPLNTRVQQIGNSVSGFPITAMVIDQSDNEIGTPNVKYVANIHGNEVVGREVLLNFMEYLDHHYKTNKHVKCLLDNVRVHILPTMNPDGFDEAEKGDCIKLLGRHNANKYDLNRNFPDYFHGNSYGVLRDEYITMIQPETDAIMTWMKHTTFVLSLSLHGGAMLANYPFDTYRGEEERNSKGEALTPDNDVVYHLAKNYVDNHKRMSTGFRCPQDMFGLSYFEDGLTNGAAWYNLKGGMQDYNYAIEGCIELTLEISCCKYPPERFLPELISENMEPLLRYGLHALQGIRGRVLNSKTQQPIAGAILYIVGRKFPFRTSLYGEFWRVLKAGVYNLRVKADGFLPVTQEISVWDYPINECPKPNMTVISLQPKNSRRRYL